MKFYVGIRECDDAARVPRAFISINRARKTKPIPSADWILDSGAFREIEQHGCYRDTPEVYAARVNALAAINPGLTAAVTQDWMCEAFMLERTGLSLAEHQRLTIARYDRLKELIAGTYLMPVLQGYSIASYVDHLAAYGHRLADGAYVGVGSLCKRNTKVDAIEAIVLAIKRARPNLRLHAFGIKTTALRSALVRDNLHSADSMAWSFAARYAGHDRNHWSGAVAFAARIDTMPVQTSLDLA
jgi:hypothetical protein